MRAPFVAVFMLVLSFAVGGCSTTQNLTDAQRAQQVVDGALATMEKFMASQDQPMDEFRALLPKAEGVLIMPGVLKGGFIVAAEGGNGVLLARDAAGRWSYPAFYFLAAGSIGLQAGGQAKDVVLLVFNHDAVQAIINHQGKLGADLGIVVGTIGAGVEASTTTNVGADVLAFYQGVGAFAGGALEAAALVRRGDLNQAYYGRPLTPGDIVMGGYASNPGADALRAVLAQGAARR